MPFQLLQLPAKSGSRFKNCSFSLPPSVRSPHLEESCLPPLQPAAAASTSAAALHLLLFCCCCEGRVISESQRTQTAIFPFKISLSLSLAPSLALSLARSLALGSCCSGSCCLLIDSRTGNYVAFFSLKVMRREISQERGNRSMG